MGAITPPRPQNPKVLVVKQCTMRLCGDNYPRAAILSQLEYWFEPSDKTGRPRASIYREGRLWVAKSSREFQIETCVSRQEQRTALEWLEASGLVVRRKMVFQGRETNHFALDIDRLHKLQAAWLVEEFVLR